MGRAAGWIGLLASVLVTSAVAAAPEQRPNPEPYTVYQDATLIDGTGGPARAHMSVLVRGERIAGVGSAATLAILAGAKIIPASGLYLLPGLINAHEHLATPPKRAFAEAMMAKELYGGVTAVRDMADDLRQVADLARAARIGEIAGPDIVYAALMAGPEFFEDPRTHAASAGGVAGQVPWMQAITPETDLRLAVARASGTGASAIKIYADLPAPMVAAITAEAHRQGMLVWAHAAVFPASPAEVIGSGVDAVSHSCMLAYQASDVMPRAYHNRAPVDPARFSGGRSARTDALLAEMRRRGTILDATLRVYVELAKAHARRPDGPAPYCGPELAASIAGEAYRRGVPMVAGTDGFSAPADPWPSLQDELQLLQDKAGMSPADVIRSATAVGAAVMGRGAEMGTVEPGKLANLVLVRDNPLRDVAALRTVVLTVKRGRAYWRRDYRPVAVTETDGPG